MITHARMHARTHAHTHTRTCSFTHTHTHTHTPAHLPPTPPTRHSRTNAITNAPKRPPTHKQNLIIHNGGNVFSKFSETCHYRFKQQFKINSASSLWMILLLCTARLHKQTVFPTTTLHSKTEQLGCTTSKNGIYMSTAPTLNE